MIRSFYGLTQNPFDHRELELLPQQQEIHDTLKVHCQQGGLCLVLGVPGTGKSVIKQSLQRLPENQHLVATVGRTLHTYTNTVKILCDAFRIEFESSAFKCERRLIEQAFSLNHAGKSLTTILDDAHLMDLANLRKLRLLFEDFPKNHNLVLIGRPSLLAALDLGVNQDIKSRVTYSVITKRLSPDAMRDFILRELDRVGLGHNTFTRPAVDLIVRSADGVLRKARNLCVGCLIEAVRSANKTIDIDNVNRVLMQPHWQKEADLVDLLTTARLEKTMISADLLRRLRNDLPMPVTIAALGRDGPPSKMSEGYFRFLCPRCGEMRATVNPRNNLAHCFCCKKNLNNIDLLITARLRLPLRRRPPRTLAQPVPGAAGQEENSGRVAAVQVSVLYLALIAFWAECCRFVIRSADGCYTENLAKIAAPALGFYPAPRSRIFIVPRHYPAPPPRR